MKYERFSAKHLEEVFAFFKEMSREGHDLSFNHYTSMEAVEGLLEDPLQYLLLGVEEDKVIAVARGKRGEGEKHHSAFLTAAVARSHRGHGIAPKLTDALLAWLKEEGVLIARIYVYSDNKASVATIEKQGFTFSGRVLMHHFDEVTGEQVDDLIYHKLL